MIDVPTEDRSVIRFVMSAMLLLVAVGSIVAWVVARHRLVSEFSSEMGLERYDGSSVDWYRRTSDTLVVGAVCLALAIREVVKNRYVAVGAAVVIAPLVYIIPIVVVDNPFQ